MSKVSHDTEKISPLLQLIWQQKFLSRSDEYKALQSWGYRTDAAKLNKNLEWLRSKDPQLYKQCYSVIQTDVSLRQKILELSEYPLAVKIGKITRDYQCPLPPQSSTISLEIKIDLLHSAETIEHDFSVILPEIMQAVECCRLDFAEFNNQYFADKNLRKDGTRSRDIETRIGLWEAFLVVFDLKECGKSPEEIARIVFGSDKNSHEFESARQKIEQYYKKAKKLIEEAKTL